MTTSNCSIMFLALAFIFVFVVLYFLIYSISGSNVYSLEYNKDETAIENETLERTPKLDFKTFLMPDQLYFLSRKKNK